MKSNVIRWVTLPFASLLGSIIVYFLVKYISYFSINYTIGTFFIGYFGGFISILSDVLATIASYLSFIYIAFLIAPSYKENTAIGMSVLSIILGTSSFVFNLYTCSNPILLQSLLSLAIIGVAVYCILTCKTWETK